MKGYIAEKLNQIINCIISIQRFRELEYIFKKFNQIQYMTILNEIEMTKDK